MSEVTNGAPATGDVKDPVLSGAPAVPASGAADPTLVSIPSDALKARLDESAAKAAAKLLKKYGFADEAALEAQLKTAKQLADEKLSESEKAANRIKELEAYEAKAKDLEARVAARTEREFNALSPEHQALVAKIAKDDRNQFEHVIETLRESGVLTAPAAPAAPVQAAPKTVAPAPAPAASGAQSKFQEWEAMQARHPSLGAMFYQNNQHEIEATRPATG